MMTSFEDILAPYKTIKDDYVVNKRLQFYIDRVERKRRAAEGARLVVLIVSLLIPIVSALDSKGLTTQKGLIVTIMSLLIAFFTGLNALYRWQPLWEAYSKAIVQIQILLVRWELEVQKAKLIDDHKDISNALETATKTLLDSVDEIVLRESGSFFESIQKNSSGSNTGNSQKEQIDN